MHVWTISACVCGFKQLEVLKFSGNKLEIQNGMVSSEY